MPKIVLHNSPNDPCWCGSGDKYKDCHLDRHKQAPLRPFVFDDKLRKQFKSEYCLHPSANPSVCKGGIVKAHTIQRMGGLSRIAENGHVMGFAFKPSLQELITNGGSFEAKRAGVKDASTFTGFCHYHDSRTFEPIEQHTYESNKKEHNLLLAYRAICREIFTKTAALESIRFQRNMDKGQNLTSQIFLQQYLSVRKDGLEVGMRMLKKEKIKYDDCLNAGDYSKIHYYVMELDRCPDIMCSFGCNPEYDFSGRFLQNLVALGMSGSEADLITCSSIGTDKGGAVVFAWLNEPNNVGRRLVRSMEELEDDRLVQATVKFLFEFGENVFFSPLWWRGLDRGQQDAIKAMCMSDYPKPPTALIPGTQQFVTWKVTSRVTNIEV